MPMFVMAAVNHVLAKKPKDRLGVGQMFERLVKSNMVSRSQCTKGEDNKERVITDQQMANDCILTIEFLTTVRLIVKTVACIKPNRTINQGHLNRLNPGHLEWSNP